MRASLDAPIRTSSDVLERILSAGRPALIVFETPGCGPCESLRPALDEVAPARTVGYTQHFCHFREEGTMAFFNKAITQRGRTAVVHRKSLDTGWCRCADIAPAGLRGLCAPARPAR